MKTFDKQTKMSLLAAAAIIAVNIICVLFFTLSYIDKTPFKEKIENECDIEVHIDKIQKNYYKEGIMGGNYVYIINCTDKDGDNFEVMMHGYEDNLETMTVTVLED